jgi:hypothetical protein
MYYIELLSLFHIELLYLLHIELSYLFRMRVFYFFLIFIVGSDLQTGFFFLVFLGNFSSFVPVSCKGFI